MVIHANDSTQITLRSHTLELFWRKVDKSGSCWMWTGGRQHAYGSFNVSLDGQHFSFRAHRFSYQLSHGPIAPGAVICHSCDTPLCVNPEHLFIGTQADNMRDKTLKGRTPRAEGHWRSKLSNADVARIHSLYSAGVSQRAIAAEFSIANSHVCRILSGKRRRATW